MGVPTHFLSPQRLAPEGILPDVERLRQNDLAIALLRASADPTAIMNEHRQIVLGNAAAARAAGRDDAELVGLRFGEAMQCVELVNAPDGCGTAPNCRYCGAAQALEAAIEFRRSETRVCRMLREPGASSSEANDLSVTTLPIDVDGRRFVAVSLRDITNDNRRATLEAAFFHGVLADATSLEGVLDIWPDLAPRERAAMIQPMVELTSRIARTTETLRDLALAEQGQLATMFDIASAREVLACAVDSCRTVASVRDVTIDVQPGGDAVLYTDRGLLTRAVVNVLTNAIEATSRGERATVGLEPLPSPVIWVRNPSVMTADVQAQIFHRAFTTKREAGRGIGTYSARLIIERYLSGRVSFTSAEDAGTIFRITLPCAADGVNGASAA